MQSENFKATQRRYEESEKGKAVSKRRRQRYPERIKARDAVNKAVATGRLLRPDFRLCYYCPKPAQQYHHWKGYAKEVWLDVVPACKECHRKAG